jgi:hypothetical protein
MRLAPIVIAICLTGCAGQASRTWQDRTPQPPPPGGPDLIARVPAPQQRFENGGMTDLGAAEWRVFRGGSRPARTVGPQYRAPGAGDPSEDDVARAMAAAKAAAEADAREEAARASTPAEAPAPPASLPGAPAAPTHAPASPPAPVVVAAAPLTLATPAPEQVAPPPPVPPPAAPPPVTPEVTTAAAPAAAPVIQARQPASRPSADAEAWPGLEHAVGTIVRDASSHGWPRQQATRLGRVPRVFVGTVADRSGNLPAPAIAGRIVACLAAKGMVTPVERAAEADLVLTGSLGQDRDLVQVDLRLSTPGGDAIWPYGVELPRQAPRVDPILGGQP